MKKIILIGLLLLFSCSGAYEDQYCIDKFKSLYPKSKIYRVETEIGNPEFYVVYTEEKYMVLVTNLGKFKYNPLILVYDGNK